MRCKDLIVLQYGHIDAPLWFRGDFLYKSKKRLFSIHRDLHG